MINASAIKGEKYTGFERAGDKGPFRCGNCEYFKDGECRQTDMVKYSKQARKNGNVVVGADDCCEYIDRKGKSWRSDESTDKEFSEGFGDMMRKRASR